MEKKLWMLKVLRGTINANKEPLLFWSIEAFYCTYVPLKWKKVIKFSSNL